MEISTEAIVMGLTAFDTEMTSSVRILDRICKPPQTKEKNDIFAINTHVTPGHHLLAAPVHSCHGELEAEQGPHFGICQGQADHARDLACVDTARRWYGVVGPVSRTPLLSTCTKGKLGR